MGCFGQWKCCTGRSPHRISQLFKLTSTRWKRRWAHHNHIVDSALAHSSAHSDNMKLLHFIYFVLCVLRYQHAFRYSNKTHNGNDRTLRHISVSTSKRKRNDESRVVAARRMSTSTLHVYKRARAYIYFSFATMAILVNRRRCRCRCHHTFGIRNFLLLANV